MDNDTCVCGHLKIHHIYEEGACRPGFVCKMECEEFRPEKELHIKQLKKALETVDPDEDPDLFNDLYDELQELDDQYNPYPRAEPTEFGVMVIDVNGNRWVHIAVDQKGGWCFEGHDMALGQWSDIPQPVFIVPGLQKNLIPTIAALLKAEARDQKPKEKSDAPE